MEEKKKEVKTTLSKKKEVKVETKKGGSYSYRYTELADINQYIENIGETYYQFIERVDNDDYIMTVRQKDGKDSNPIRGCRIVQANLETHSNPAQEQGSALTYARRYSLLMAYGLATEDDDAQSLSKPKIETKEEAENYVINFGKHKGKTLKEIEEETPDYIDWLMNNDKTDEVIKSAIKLLRAENKEITPYGFMEEMPIQEGQIQNIEMAIEEGLTTLEGILTEFKVDSLGELNYKQAYQIEKVIDKRRIKNISNKKEVF